MLKPRNTAIIRQDRNTRWLELKHLTREIPSDAPASHEIIASLWYSTRTQQLRLAGMEGKRRWAVPNEESNRDWCFRGHAGARVRWEGRGPSSLWRESLESSTQRRTGRLVHLRGQRGRVIPLQLKKRLTLVADNQSVKPQSFRVALQTYASRTRAEFIRASEDANLIDAERQAKLSR